MARKAQMTAVSSGELFDDSFIESLDQPAAGASGPAGGEEESGLGLIAEGMGNVGKSAYDTLVKAWEGEDVDFDNLDQLKKEESDKQEFFRRVREKAGETGMTFAQAAESLGYSGAAMLAGAGASAAAGAAVGSAVPGVGTLAGAAAGFVAGGATQLGITYRATKNDFLRSAMIRTDELVRQDKGRGMTREEWDRAKEYWMPYAEKYAWAEALPETAGEIFLGKAFGKASKVAKAIVGGGKGALRATSRFAVDALLGFGEEMVGESITQKLQSEIEYESGLSDKKPTDLLESAKEVAGVTGVTTTAMVGLSRLLGLRPRRRNRPGADQQETPQEGGGTQGGQPQDNGGGNGGTPQEQTPEQLQAEIEQGPQGGDGDDVDTDNVQSATAEEEFDNAYDEAAEQGEQTQPVDDSEEGPVNILDLGEEEAAEPAAELPRNETTGEVDMLQTGQQPQGTEEKTPEQVFDNAFDGAATAEQGGQAQPQAQEGQGGQEGFDEKAWWDSLDDNALREYAEQFAQNAEVDRSTGTPRLVFTFDNGTKEVYQGYLPPKIFDMIDELRRPPQDVQNGQVQQGAETPAAPDEDVEGWLDDIFGTGNPGLNNGVPQQDTQPAPVAEEGMGGQAQPQAGVQEQPVSGLVNELPPVQPDNVQMPPAVQESPQEEATGLVNERPEEQPAVRGEQAQEQEEKPATEQKPAKKIVDAEEFIHGEKEPWETLGDEREMAKEILDRARKGKKYESAEDILDDIFDQLGVKEDDRMFEKYADIADSVFDFIKEEASEDEFNRLFGSEKLSSDMKGVKNYLAEQERMDADGNREFWKHLLGRLSTKQPDWDAKDTTFYGQMKSRGRTAVFSNKKDGGWPIDVILDGMKRDNLGGIHDDTTDSEFVEMLLERDGFPDAATRRRWKREEGGRKPSREKETEGKKPAETEEQGYKNENISSIANRADAIEKTAGKLDDGLKGKKQIVKKIASLKETLQKHRSLEQMDDAFVKDLDKDLAFIEETLRRMEPSEETSAMQKEVEGVKTALEKEGYELVDMVGTKYDNGMIVTANFKHDTNVAEGEQIITGVQEHQINKDGKMIRSATITVSQNIPEGWVQDQFGHWHAPEATEKGETQKPEQEKGPEDYGTMDKPNVPAIAGYFQKQFESGKQYKTIGEARQEIMRLLKGSPAEIPTHAKMMDEAIELGVVMEARRIAAQGKDAVETYRDLVDLYNRQPNLGSRTLDSKQRQAYSTPTPIAFLAAKLAGIDENTTVYEPSAGNGALLITANPANVQANELDHGRAERLRAQGFEVTENDATAHTIKGKVDAVIANPPFGSVQTENGNKKWTVLDFETTQIDQAIMLKALGDLKENGRAVIIIGGKMGDEEKRKMAYRSENQRGFYRTLYANFNVTDHFSISGDLYKKQGAGYPIDVIVIDGARPTPNPVYPGGRAPRMFNSFEELEEKLNGIQTASAGERPASEPVNGHAGTEQPNGSANGSGERTGDSSGKRDEGTGGKAAEDAGSVREPDVGRGDVHTGGMQPGRSDGESGTVRDMEPADGRKDVSDQTGERGGQRTGDVGRNDGGTDTGGTGLDVNTEQAQKPDLPQSDKAKEAVAKPAETETQGVYSPKSDGMSLGTLVPKNMQAPVQTALERTAAKHGGDVDAYVAKELGYKDKNELHKHFAAEQVDALALAIDNISEGKGFVLGDQTGIGKGRVCAAIIRWARKNGKIPVFVTMQPDLYSDMMRDVADIGSKDEVHPLPTNTGLRGDDALLLPSDYWEEITDAQAAKLNEGEWEEFLDENGNVVKKKKTYLTSLPGKKHTDAINSITKTGKLPDGYDTLFTTYAQLQQAEGKPNPRRPALEALKNNAVLILDEAHNAGGSESTIGTFMRELTSTMQGGVLYSSATFAKRPDVMSLYNKTGLSEIGEAKDLEDIAKKGGLQMQQVISATLTDNGQYLRREKSYEGAEMETVEVDVPVKTADAVSTSMQAIMDFSDAMHTIKKELGDIVAANGGVVKDLGSTGEKGADTISFGSLMHNLISQSTLAMKAKAVVDSVEKAVKNREKPVIALSNTMGSFLEDELSEKGILPGEEVDLTFGKMFKMYLDKCRTVIIDSKAKRKEDKYYVIPVEDLPPKQRSLYRKAEKMCESEEFANLPVSPIDYIRSELQKRGISCDEITGRSATLEYKDGKCYFKGRRESSPAAKKRASDGFNGGNISVLVINRSGSTGISLHASEKFKDQSRRTMMILQPDLNIDVFMQTLGRVFRTGQVTPPKYQFIISGMPSEKRPAAVLGKKLASLNANTTASRKGTQNFDNLPDYLNAYGDMAALDILSANPRLRNRLKLSLPGAKKERGKQGGDEGNIDGLMAKLTGRLPLLTQKEQAEVYELIDAAYKAIEQVAKEEGRDILDTKPKPFDAKVVRRAVFTPDKGNGDKFSGASYVCEVDIKAVNKPYTSNEVRQHVEEGIKKEIPPEQTFIETRDYVRAKTNGMDYDDKKSFQKQIEKQRDQIEDCRREYPVGSKVRVTSTTGSHIGVVVGYTRSKVKEGGNPVAPSNWRVVVDVADEKKRSTIPMSKLVLEEGELPEGKILLNHLSNVTNEDLLSRFDNGQKEVRSKRIIVMGNIIAGFGKTLNNPNGKGDIITFEMHDGTIAMGILMPKDMTAEQVLNAGGVKFENKDHAYQFITTRQDGRIEIDGGVIALTVTHNRNGAAYYTLRLPSSKQNWTSFLTEEKLNRLKELTKDKDFVQGSKDLYAAVEADKVREIIDQVDAWGKKFQTNTDTEDARKITGQSSLFENVKEGDGGGTMASVSTSSVEGWRKGAGVSAGVVREYADNMAQKAKGAAPVVIVQSFEELPAQYQEHFRKQGISPKKLEGFYSSEDGIVYMVADNLSEERIAVVWAHEQMGHNGLRAILGEKGRKQLLNRLFEMLGGKGNKELAAMAEEYTFDLDTEQGRQKAVEELIAHKAENENIEGAEEKLWRRIWRHIADTFKAMWYKATGNKAKLGELEIKNIIRQSRQYVREGGRSKSMQGIGGLLASIGWHGSPYRFERFMLDHIGTGEGVQMHGWGLYFAKNRDVGERYRERLASKTGDTGQLYNVEIPDDDVLIDEQKLFSEQSETVQRAYKKILANLPKDKVNRALPGYENDLWYPGRVLYFGLADILGSQEAASRLLNEHGIKGITYDGKEDGRSYVIFDDKSIKTLDVYASLAIGQALQEETSEDTSIPQVAAVLKKIPWKKGTRNLDIGGGKYDLGTEYLKEQGVENVVFDPYNRKEGHNLKTIAILRGGENFDTATIANVLNVIKEPEYRAMVIRQAARAIKKDGKAYFSIYERNGDGIGEKTTKGWQNNMKAEAYLPEVVQYFGKVERHGNVLVASEPKVEGPVEWIPNGETGDQVMASVAGDFWKGLTSDPKGFIKDLGDEYGHLSAQASRDVGKIRQSFMLPAVMAKKWPVIGRLLDVQRNRDSKRQEAFNRAMTGMDEFATMRSKDKTAYKYVQDIIYSMDGNKTVKLKEDRFITDPQTKNITGLNDKHYDELRDLLLNKAAKNKIKDWKAYVRAVDLYIKLRRSLDTDQLAIIDRVQTIAPKNQIDRIRNQIGTIPFYFPHQRFGNYYIKVTDKATGDTVYRTHIDAHNKLTAAAGIAALRKKLEKNYDPSKYDYESGRVTGLPEEMFDKTMDTEKIEAVLLDALDDIKKQGKMAGKDLNSVKAAIVTQVAKLLKEHGFGQHMIRRRDIAGYEMDDIFKSLMAYKSGLYGWLTKMDAAKEFGDVISDHLQNNDVKETPTLWGYIKNYVQDMLRNSDEIDRSTARVKTFFFIKFLGANIKTATVNATQNLTLGLPVLSREIGMGNAHAMYLKDAARTIMDRLAGVTGKGRHSHTLTQEEQDFLDDFFVKGAGQAQLYQEWTQLASGMFGNMAQRFVNIMGLPMREVERFNRMSLALAAYRAAKAGKVKFKKTLAKYKEQPGIGWSEQNARAFAQEVVDEVHFVYGKANRPQALRHSPGGRWLSTAYTFRTFSHNLASWLWRNLMPGKVGIGKFKIDLGGGENGWRGRAAVMQFAAATMTLGGLTAVPLYNSFVAAVRGLSDGDDPDEWLKKEVGEGDLLDVIMYGMPALTGVYLGGSMSLEVPVVSRLKNGSSWWAQSVNMLAEQVLGVPYSIMMQTGKAADYAFGGQYRRAAEEILPAFAANVMKAERLAEEGKRTKGGKPIGTEDTRLTTSEKWAQYAGYTPVRYTKGYREHDSKQARLGRKQETQYKLVTEYAQAMRKMKGAERNAELTRIKKEIQAWNVKHPSKDMRIDVGHVEYLAKQREKPLK